MQNNAANNDAPKNYPILLFDGVCNLCNGFVQWVIRRDEKALFRFAALQSDVGQHLLNRAGLSTEELSTVVLYHENTFYTHSDVPLIVLKKLGPPSSILYIFRMVPKSLRDAVYNWVALNRYRWFGKKESCMIPTPELKSRFLDW